MKLLKLTYHDGSKEEMRTKTIESAHEIIRRRNAPFISKATFHGVIIDLEPFKKIYSKPKTFLEKFPLGDILLKYMGKKKKLELLAKLGAV